MELRIAPLVGDLAHHSYQRSGVLLDLSATIHQLLRLNFGGLPKGMT
jgi:hypothetical protein